MTEHRHDVEDYINFPLSASGHNSLASLSLDRENTQSESKQSPREVEPGDDDKHLTKQPEPLHSPTKKPQSVFGGSNCDTQSPSLSYSK